MKFDIKKYEKEITFDKPIEYVPLKVQNKIQNILNNLNKRNDEENKKSIAELDKLMKQKISIYPVKMIDYFDFYTYVSCILIEKNKISNVKIISMSYLDFIMFIIKNDPEKGTIYSSMLTNLFKLCCRIKEKNIKKLEYKPEHYYLYLNDIEFTKKDFDIIKKIICYQNMPSYDDRYINPDIQKEIDEYNKLKNKDMDASLEKQIVSLMASRSYKIEEIENMTIRKFLLTLEKVDKKLHYQIYTLARFIPFVEIKQDVPHWIYGTDEDKLKGKLIDAEGFKNKIGSSVKG